MQAGMYATPIIYPLTMVTSRSMKAGAVLMLSPIATIIQDLRNMIIDPANLTIRNIINTPWITWIPYILPFVVFVIGLVVFTKNSKRFAEIL